MSGGSNSTIMCQDMVNTFGLAPPRDLRPVLGSTPGPGSISW